MTPSLVVAQWTEFVPRPVENGAFFDLLGTFERDNSRGGTRSIRWTDTFFREKLTVYSLGYSYHPRFVQYRFSLAAAGKQEDYDSSTLGSSGWRSTSGFEYDTRLFFLPEHPYNLDVYASRYEQLYRDRAATQQDSVATRHGTSFRYRQKPYFVRANYDENSIDTGASSSDVRRAGVDGVYFKRYPNGNELSFSGAFNPSWFSNSLGLDGRSTDYLLGNFLNLWQVRLDSTLTKSTFEQEGRFADSFESDHFAWRELLSARLPWNFRTNLSYRHQDDEATIDGRGDAPVRRRSSSGEDLQFALIHRLYQSVDTTYTLARGERTSFGGETSALSHALSVNYTKAIPRGRIIAGTNASTGETDSRGQSDVVNEPHSSTPVPGSFTLDQQNVEAGSVVVFLRSPLEPFETIRLVENLHYILVPVLNSFEVRLLTLPPEFLVPGTYDFFVSYSLTIGDFGLRLDTFGGSTTVELLDNLLAPYFSYLAVRSDVVSGIFPATPIDSDTYTTGLLVTRGPLRARGEYQRLEWEISPFRAWRAELQWVSGLTATTSVYAAASYLNKHYPRGTSVFFARSFTEEAMSVTGSVQKRLSWNLYVSGGGSYSRTQGLVDGNAYSLNTSLGWNVGKLNLSVGASAYGSDTSGGTSVSTRRDHQLFYVRLRRYLF